MKSKSKPITNLRAFLDSAGSPGKIVAYRRGEVIFSQGDAPTSVMHVQEGAVKLSVRSELGREAVVAVRGPGDFFGEGCLAGQRVRTGTATAITPSTILVLRKAKMVRLLHDRPELTDRFIAHMLSTNIRIERDLLDQIFNHYEKRLARTLLLLARYGKQGKPQRVLPNLSRDTLARMADTTRAKVDFFMKKFKRLGFIENDRQIKINDSLLSVVLRE
ncbi:MAG TPA: Crp/Fnr family transcriptional regulator [Vicinamibacterales bacterium]|jgi:CRP-like cAMP-binding protein